MIFFVSCKKNDSSDNNDTELTMEDLVVSSNFEWETAKPVNIKIYARDNQDNTIPGVKLFVYTDFPDEGGSLILSGVTNASGLFECDYSIPAYCTDLVITTDYIGLPNAQKVTLENGNIEFTFGGKSKKSATKETLIPKSTNSEFRFLGTYNSQGVPDYLEPIDDVIDAIFLNDINNTLPESAELPVSHPQYFGSSIEHNLVLTMACDVWITFVHEGAGYRNVLGFYSYEIGNPPTSVADIDSITIIFPNVSFAGSGGGLYSGNKVHIGSFAPNTEICWILIADGWQGGTVTNGKNIYYSIPELNPESNPDIQQHSVFLNDPGRNLLLIGFEDLRRDQWTDEDFNDAVFYAKVSPIQAVDPTDLPLVDYTGTDSDGDNVPDHFDDYPNDPDKAFNNYYYSLGNYGTIAFEDLWPGTGDYDFNDIVVDYNFNEVTNGENKVVEINATFILKAFGASFHNGFGFELPIEKSLVSNVSGIKILENYINLDSKNLEAGQTNAVIIVFDDAYNLMSHPGGGSIGVNTSPSAPYVTPDTINVKVELTNPVSHADIGVPPYNPFIIINQNRDYEVHLPDKPPTDLANESLFGTYRDDSDPASGRYYKTENNLPWAINIIEQFDYPVEKVEILQAYLKFADWAQSGGSTYYDWYKDISGYRNSNNIYTVPE